MKAAAGGRLGVEPFPWEASMHIGLCLLRLKPQDFWSLTPIEFFAMAGGLKPRGHGIDGQRLDALMGDFPDQDA
ncbi:phage tail assembly chaperone [Neorhizobium lilium]|uniref:Phage tail assembly chaperone n=1 Tax=Neorhizobium lilium TaxID=2503024 RepID=A0A3S3RHF8_9HYPH|nr:rcc01693 family protein [Neorhizobium lilium]RWX76008.1 phage tail assembly chaperone [Neorhizobium lilium]